LVVVGKIKIQQEAATGGLFFSRPAMIISLQTRYNASGGMCNAD
jgi:hypothetical protein